jgi:hypothetical protein
LPIYVHVHGTLATVGEHNILGIEAKAKSCQEE